MLRLCLIPRLVMLSMCVCVLFRVFLFVTCLDFEGVVRFAIASQFGYFRFALILFRYVCVVCWSSSGTSERNLLTSSPLCC